MKVADILDLGRIQIFHRADRRALVRILLVGVLQYIEEEAPVRRILEAQAAFFLHHLAFLLEILFADVQR